jgi:hypothetical protein
VGAVVDPAGAAVGEAVGADPDGGAGQVALMATAKATWLVNRDRSWNFCSTWTKRPAMSAGLA